MESTLLEGVFANKQTADKRLVSAPEKYDYNYCRVVSESDSPLRGEGSDPPVWGEDFRRQLEERVRPLFASVHYKFKRRNQNPFTIENSIKYNASQALKKFMYKIEKDFKSLFRFFSTKGEFIFDVNFWYSFIYAIYKVVRYQSKFDLVLSLTNLVNVFLGKKVNEYSARIYSFVNNFIETLTRSGKVKSEALVFDEIKFSLRDHIDVVLDSQLVSSCRLFVLQLVSFRFFSRDVADKFTLTLGKAAPCSILEFSLNTLTVIENFVHFTGDVINGQGILTSLCKADPFSKWLDMSVSFINKANNVYLGEDVNFPHLLDYGKIDARSYMSELSDHIRDGEKLRDKSKKKFPRIFQDRLYQLKDLKGGIFQKMSSYSRMAPMGVIVHGNPSIGKSSIIDHLTKVFCRAKGLKYSKDLTYHRPALSDHWTGYEPLTQPVIHYSELGSMHSNIAARTGDSTINELLNVIDSQPYQVEMADLDHKGKVFVLADLVIMDVNDPELNLKYIQSNPAAVRRRFLYIDVSVKPIYRKDGGTELDKTKIPHDLEDKMNLWHFTPYIQESLNITESRRKVFPKPDGSVIYDIYDISSFFFSRVLNHEVEQEKYRNAVSEEIDKYLGPTADTDDASLTSSVLHNVPRAFDPDRDVDGYFTDTRTPHTGIPISESDPMAAHMERFATLCFKDENTDVMDIDALDLLKYEIKNFLERTVPSNDEDKIFYEQMKCLYKYFEDVVIPNKLGFALFSRLNEHYTDIGREDMTLRIQMHVEKIFFDAVHDERLHNIPPAIWNNMHDRPSRIEKSCETSGDYKKKDEMDTYFEIHRGKLFSLFVMGVSFWTLPHMYFLFTCPILYAGYGISRFTISQTCICDNFSWYKKLRYKCLDTFISLYLEFYEFWWANKAKNDDSNLSYMISVLLWIPRKIRTSVGDKTDFWFKWSADLFTFMFVILVIKLVLRIANFTYSYIKSESDVIQSTNTFNPNECDDHIKSFEMKSGCTFPLPKKKNQSDKDYDHVESFIPRVPSDSVTYNQPLEVYNFVNKNVRYVHTICEGKVLYKSVGVGICGDIFLMNRHCFKPGSYVEVSVRENKAVGVTRHLFSEETAVYFGEDMVLLRLIGCLFKDIRSTITDIPDSKVSVRGIFKGENLVMTPLSNEIPVYNSSRPYVITKGYMYSYPDHRDGICGSPVLLTYNNQTVFSGIHTAARDGYDECFSTFLRGSELNNAIDTLKKKVNLSPVFSEGMMRLPSGSTISAVTQKSPLLFEDTPGLLVVGSILPYKNVTPKSTLVRSNLLPHIKDLLGENPYTDGGQLKYLPPLMRSRRIDGEFVSPSNVWIRKVGIIKNPLPEKEMSAVVDSISSLLISRLWESGVETLRPINLEVAQNGFPENFYMRAMKNNTSGGFMLPGKKSKYNEPCSFDFKEDSVMPNFVVKEQVLETLSSYEREENSHVLVGAQLKDEPRELSKVMNGKTRIFAMSSYDSTLVQRMYLMPFYSLMCEHRDLFYTKVGINMHSSEAESLYNSLGDFSLYIMEGDYGGYDTSMPTGIGLMANTVVLNILESLGYNEFAMNQAKGILSDNLFPAVCLEGNIFLAPGFQPSGKYATAEDNSLRGLILLYYAYGIMCTPLGKDSPHNKTQDFSLSEFHNLLLPVTYGDDMLCSVKPVLIEYFNNITYADFVKDVYGMDFTTSDKVRQTSKFVDLERISFLKRNFVYNSLVGRIVAKLDKESLVKSLMYILPSKEVSLETQIIETSGSCLRELFFHCESLDEYDNYLEKFIDRVSLVTGFKASDIREYFPSGTELLEKYSMSPLVL